MEMPENGGKLANGKCVEDCQIEGTEDAEIVRYRGKRRKVDDGGIIKYKRAELETMQEAVMDNKLLGSGRVLRSSFVVKTSGRQVDKQVNRSDFARDGHESNQFKNKDIKGDIEDTVSSKSHKVGQPRRGRPLKVKKEAYNEMVGRLRNKVKRKRGRPQKLENKVDNPPFCGTRKKLKRKRGRPRKIDKEDDNTSASGGLKKKSKRKVGRPPKLQERTSMEGKMGSRDIDLNIRSGAELRELCNTQLLEKTSVGKKLNAKKILTRENSKQKRDFESKSDNPGLPMQSSVIILNYEEWKNKVNGEAKDKKGEHSRSEAKQLLRDRIVQMLFGAGWRIEYRPRSSKEYLDAVYVSPGGKTHWSVTLAYKVLKKHYEEGAGDSVFENDFKFTPIAEEEFSTLTRLTKVSKKKEKLKLLARSFENKKKTQIGKKAHKEMMNSPGSCIYNSLNGKRKGSLRDLKQSKTQDRRQCALVVRNAEEGTNAESDGFLLYNGKRTLLSWMIDLGIFSVNEKVKYMNQRRTRSKLDGRIRRDGIHCDCCNEVVTVSKFEIHAGSKLSQPFENIFLGNGASLLQCLLDSWNRQQKSDTSRFCFIDVDREDPNDDTCGICGDGGDLICCDSCPSTFHQSCLDIKKFPSGNWNCLYCSCKFCGMVSRGSNHIDSHESAAAAICRCCLCEEKYHSSCALAKEGEKDGLDSLSFCGKKCQELFARLQMLFGVTHELEEGFSWTLIHRFDVDSDSLSSEIHQKVHCNSKLAVALFIMDECFLPIIDHRSGINLIQNILYNCGSNFKRLDYGGFYTAVLERDNEIISAASISELEMKHLYGCEYSSTIITNYETLMKIHGNHLAEMPFIGTRYIYRRQGMCRRLLNGIESLLCSLNVEKLVIPAIPELRDTWTSVFGFKCPEEASKRKMKNISMLVFPGVDMLEKPLSPQLSAENMLHAEELNSSQIFPYQTSDKAVLTADEGCSMRSDISVVRKDVIASPGFEITNDPPPVESTATFCDNSFDDASAVVIGFCDVQNCDTVPQFGATCDKLEEKSSSPGDLSDSVAPFWEQNEKVIKYKDPVNDSTFLIPDDKVLELNSEATKLENSEIKKSKHFKKFHLESEAPNCEGTSHSTLNLDNQIVCKHENMTDNKEISHESREHICSIFQLDIDSVQNSKLSHNLETPDQPYCDGKDFNWDDSDQLVSESTTYLEIKMPDIHEEEFAHLHNRELLSPESCSVSSSSDTFAKTRKIPRDVANGFPATTNSCYSLDQGNENLLETDEGRFASGSCETNFNNNPEQCKTSTAEDCNSCPLDEDLISDVFQINSTILEPDLKVNKDCTANCNAESLCNSSSGSAVALHCASGGGTAAERGLGSDENSSCYPS